MSSFLKPNTRFATSKYYNTIRYYLIQQIKNLHYEKDTLNKTIKYQYTILSEFLRTVESFNSTEFKTGKEAAKILSFTSSYMNQYCDTISLGVSKKQMVDYVELIIKDIISLFNKSDQLPLVPYRHVLSKEKWEEIWRYFDQKLKPRKSTLFLTDDSVNFKKIIEFVSNNITLLYYINPVFYQHSYELSSQWFKDIYSGNDYYWIDKSFEWCIYADGNGYPELYGSTIVEIINS